MMDVEQARALYKSIDKFKQLHPVRAEQTGERNLDFSAWVRKNGRPSKHGCKVDGIEIGCFVAYDLDFILHDYYNKYLMLLEVKTNNGKVGYGQRETLSTLDHVLRAGTTSTISPAGITYLGLHYLRMSGTDPNNSAWIEWNGATISIRECWERLLFLDKLFRPKESAACKHVAPTANP